jgi:hypothetical protein
MVEIMPCSWEPVECGELPVTGTPEYENLRLPAAEVLWKLSGRQYGCCVMTIRPCRDDCGDICLPSAGAWDSATQWLPVLSGGQWYNIACRRCRGRCSCPAVPEIRIPGPVCEVMEVVIGGDVVPTGSYRVDDLEWLVRTDGGTWPTCQAMAPALTEPNTFGVKEMRGEPLPPGGQRALGELMSELYKACKNDKTCCLPRGVQTIAKQGLSLNVLQPLEFLDKGKTGLYWTDLWLSAVNPLARREGARVTSPDWPESRETTWPT